MRNDYAFDVESPRRGANALRHSTKYPRSVLTKATEGACALRRQVLLVAMFLALPGVALAQSFPIVTLSKDQRTPAVSYGSTQKAYLVVYQDGYPGEIRACLIPSKIPIKGQLAPANVPVSVGGSQSRRAPDVAYNPKNDKFLVIWEQELSLNDHNILGQVVNGKGALDGSNFKIADTSEMESSPRVAYNPDSDEFLVGWEFGKAFKGPAQVRGRRLTGSGATEWPDFKIVDADMEKAIGVSRPAVSYGKQAVGYQYLVVWEHQEKGRINGRFFVEYDLRGRLISPLGKPKSSGFCISCKKGTTTRAINEMQPSVAYNPGTANWLVVYSMNAMDSSQQRHKYDEDIAGIPVHGGGPAYASLVTINVWYPHSPKRRRHPYVVYYSSSNRFLVSWEEDVVEWGQSEVWSRYLYSDGEPVKHLNLAMQWYNYAHYVGRPAQAVGNDNILTVWVEESPNTGFDLYGTFSDL